MTLNGAPRPSVTDAVVQQLLTAIETGEVRPGSQLPNEPELARQLGVGRTSLREALGRLRELGVVEVRRGRGTFVHEQPMHDPRVAFAQWTARHHDQVLGLFEVRMALEAAAAALAADRAQRDEIRTLRIAAEDHRIAGSEGSIDDLVETDQRFHRHLVAAAHNEALERVYGLLVPQLVEYRTKSLALDGAPTRSADDHFMIVDAVESGPPEHARAALLRHLATLYSEVQGAAVDNDGHVQIRTGTAPLI